MTIRAYVVALIVGLGGGIVLRDAWPVPRDPNAPTGMLREEVARAVSHRQRREPSHEDEAPRVVRETGADRPVETTVPTPDASKELRPYRQPKWLVDDRDHGGEALAQLRVIQSKVLDETIDVLRARDALPMLERDFAAWPVLPLVLTEADAAPNVRSELPAETQARVQSRMHALTERAGNDAEDLANGHFQFVAFRSGDGFFAVCGAESGVLTGGNDFYVISDLVLLQNRSININSIPEGTVRALVKVGQDLQRDQLEIRLAAGIALREAVTASAATDCSGTSTVAIASVSGVARAILRGDDPELDRMIDELEADRFALRKQVEGAFQ